MMILRRADIRKSPLALVVECRVLTVALFSQERGQQVSLVIAIPDTLLIESVHLPECGSSVSGASRLFMNLARLLLKHP